MRISVDKNDLSYHPYAYMIEAVLFNEEQLYDVITADEELGEIIRNTRDENGVGIFDWAKGEMQREMVTGKVEIILGDKFIEMASAQQKGIDHADRTNKSLDL